MSVSATRYSSRPLLALPFVCLGLLAVAIALALLRSSTDVSGQFIFWAGAICVLAPVAHALTGSSASRNERLLLVVMLGVGLYAVKVLREPSAFTFPDEFGHQRSVQNILVTHHLFARNPVQPIAALYPGIHVLTAAVSQVSGLSVFTSGMLIVASARVLLTGALFLIFEELTQDARISGLATAVYCINSNFLFEGAQFAYESAAVPLAMFVLLLTLRRRSNRSGLLPLVISVAAVVVSHHLTTIALATVLFAWCIAALYLRRRSMGGGPPVLALGLCVGLAGIWFAAAAPATYGYLSPHVEGGFHQLLDLLRGHASRQPFTTRGPVAPIAEQLISVASILLLLIGLLLGALHLLRRRPWRHPLVPVLLLAGVLYPPTLLLRLTAEGQEASSRAPEFLFLGVGLLVASAAARFEITRPAPRALTVALLSAAFVGQVTLGFAFYARFPGPFRVSAGPRSVDGTGIFAARWAGTHLPPRSRIVDDRIGAKLMGSYGFLDPVSAVADRINAGPLLLDSSLDASALNVLRRGKVRYVIADRRLLASLPFDGVYVESGEPGSPLQPTAVHKFAARFFYRRAFDSGAIQIYSIPPG